MGDVQIRQVTNRLAGYEGVSLIAMVSDSTASPAVNW
jgi:hypothetical protein